ncbi:unnamed protein product [Dovyalis caffra]|uniref:Protein kinase domain-containing protein n=1 Tax=Dovyalis caffra TaxID=77055 RepID=A0AAV1RWD3_9ROSI|nr:unnamed protein product [Dovyalis caffra]
MYLLERCMKPLDHYPPSLTIDVSAKSKATSSSNTIPRFLPHHIVVGSSVGAVVLLITTMYSVLLVHAPRKQKTPRPRYGYETVMKFLSNCLNFSDDKHIRNLSFLEQHRDSLPVQKLVSSLSNAHGEAAHRFTSFEIKDATNDLEKKIGSGGFGVVYGKTKVGREIAAKVLTSNSYQEKPEFFNF